MPIWGSAMNKSQSNLEKERAANAKETSEDNKLGVRKKYSDKLIQHTLEVWQPMASKQLTKDDAKIILDNTIDYFRLLMRWNRTKDIITNNTEDSEC